MRVVERKLEERTVDFIRMGGVFDLSVRMGEYILDMGTMLSQKHVERIRNITLALSAIT